MRAGFVFVGLGGAVATAALLVSLATRCQNTPALVGLGLFGLDLGALGFIVTAFVVHARQARANPSATLNEVAANFLALIGLSVGVSLLLLARYFFSSCPPV